MLAARSVRRLSIRAPDDALARRAAFLVEDALRTASLPGDGGELVLLRRLRLPPFAASASPQQVASGLAAACREAWALDGALSSDAGLAAASAVRFADALTAHLALTRLILSGASRQAWCWRLLAAGYHPTMASGPALRAVALSLAALPEAPAALPHWLALLLTHGEAACVRFLLALARTDVTVLDEACGDASGPAISASQQAWQAALASSARQLGPDDHRHRWLERMALRSGVAPAAGLSTGAPRVAAAAVAESAGASAAARHAAMAELTAGPASATAGAATAGSASAVPVATDGVAAGQPQAAAPRSSAAAAAVKAGRAPAELRPPSAAAVGSGGEPATVPTADDRAALAGARHPQPPPANGVRSVAIAAGAPATAATPAGKGRLAAAGSQASAPQPATPETPVSAAVAVADRLAATAAAGAEGIVRRQPTAAGGLLFLIPLLNGLGFAAWLAEDAGRRDVPQRILGMLLRRLRIDGDDPIWQLCDQPLAAAVAAECDAAHWLRRCREHLRRRVGIGLHSLVCRPARVSLTPTHVDVWQDPDAADLRLRRAGLDLDPGWVPWLGRVLCFHYRRGDW